MDGRPKASPAWIELGVVAPHVLEGVEVAGRRVAGLGAGDVEPDDARSRNRMANSAIRGPGGMPHGGDEAADRDRLPLPPPRPSIGEPGQHRVHDLVEHQTAVDVAVGANRTSA